MYLKEIITICRDKIYLVLLTDECKRGLTFSFQLIILSYATFNTVLDKAIFKYLPTICIHQICHCHQLILMSLNNVTPGQR